MIAEIWHSCPGIRDGAQARHWVRLARVSSISHVYRLPGCRLCRCPSLSSRGSTDGSPSGLRPGSGCSEFCLSAPELGPAGRSTKPEFAIFPKNRQGIVDAMVRRTAGTVLAAPPAVVCIPSGCSISGSIGVPFSVTRIDSACRFGDDGNDLYFVFG